MHLWSLKKLEDIGKANSSSPLRAEAGGAEGTKVVTVGVFNVVLSYCLFEPIRSRLMILKSWEGATDGPPVTEKEARGQRGLADQEGDILCAGDIH